MDGTLGGRLRWWVVVAGVVGVLGALLAVAVGLVVLVLAADGAGLGVVAVAWWWLVAVVLTVLVPLRWLVAAGDPDQRDPFALPAVARVSNVLLTPVAVAVVCGLVVAGAGADLSIGFLPLVLVPTGVVVAALAALVGRWRFLGCFAAGAAIAVGLGALGVPSAARLAAAEADVVAAGRQVLDGADPDRAGSYGFVRTYALENGCAVLVTQELVDSVYGLAYCPTPPPSAEPGLTRRSGSVYDYEFVG